MAPQRQGYQSNQANQRGERTIFDDSARASVEISKREVQFGLCCKNDNEGEAYDDEARTLELGRRQQRQV